MSNRSAITRRELLQRLGLGAAGVAAAGLLRPRGALSAEAPRPNLLYIMSDQHRWDFLGSLGHPLVQTPTMDRLAREGVHFDAAYCQAPLCVPSRMSEITGRYVHSHGALSNGYALPEAERTIGHHFKDNGYVTGAIGKMHFVDEDQHHGFDYVINQDDYFTATGKDFKPNPAGPVEPLTTNRRRKPRRATGKDGAAGIGDETDEQTYEHWLADRFVAWLEKPPTQPFCMWLSFHAPHPPYLTPEVYYKLYEGKVSVPEQPPAGAFMPQGTHKGDLPEAVQLKMIAAYMGRITSVDTQIGRALAALEQAGLTESTIISYTADHGDMLGERNRYGKTVMYDSSARIPLIIRYPQALPQGVRRREVVEHVDLYPTFCDLTGLPTPDTVQGHSLLPVMQGHAGDWPDTAFSELADKVLVRQGQHKLTFYDGKPLELYDIEQDPREWDNLVGKPGSDEVVAHLTQLRDEWMARTPPDIRNQVQPLRAGRRRRRIEEIEEPDAQ